MDEESRKLVEDCFLRPMPDPRTTNSVEQATLYHSRLKTELQVLRLTEEAQTMVMRTLKNIHGSDFKFGDAAKYKDKGGHVKKSYWEDRGTLMVQSVSDYSNSKESELKPEDQLRRYAIMKLETYGFPSKHCGEALDHCKGELDKALELLFSKYMKCKFGKLSDEEEDFTENDLLEMRKDEKLALESIYDTAFEEKEKNIVWSLKFKLEHLLEYSPSQKKKLAPPKGAAASSTLKKAICRNFRKGHCKFGVSCRFSHKIEIKEPIEKETPGDRNPALFHLEIRFPKDVRYPYQAPIVLLKTICYDIPGTILLHISKKLFKQAEELAKDGMPSIYTISELLQMPEEITEFLKIDRPGFPDPDVSLFETEAEHQNGEAKPKMDIPSHFKMGSTGSSKGRKLTPEQILKEDKNLINKFFEKRKKDQNYRNMLKVRQNLPAWNSMLDIIETVNNSQVVVISGETGCGKSTQVAQFLLDNWMFTSSSLEDGEITHCEIVCTQPRRLSAIGVAERVAAERSERIGDTVGYQIRLENKISSSTRLTFCTTGILLQRLYSDPFLESVSHVIVDEVHERSEESDFLLLILKDILSKRKDLKVILMSATLNANIFSEYFKGIPVLNIPGRTFPVEQLFLEDILDRCGFVLETDSQYCRRITKREQDALLEELEYADTTASNESPPKSIKDENLKLAALYARYPSYSRTTCKSIYLLDAMKVNPELIESVLEYIVKGDHDWPKEGSILVFLPGLGEIQTVHESLCDSRTFGPRSGKFTLVPLHSTLTNEEQALVFQKPPRGRRKIILSTNIAETSVTIDDCVFVVDTGLMKEKRFDDNRNMESLDLVWESRANAMQRKGRAGRVMPGVCIHLFTSNRFSQQMLSQPVPEIHRVPLEQMLLRIKTLPNFRDANIMDVIGNTIEPPSDVSVLAAVRRLQDAGAFDEIMNLTALGHHLSSLPVDIRIGKFLLFGAIFQCIDSVLTIAACLSHKSPFVNPFSKREEANRKKKSFAIYNSDHLTVLNAYKKWSEASRKSTHSGRCYADDNFLSWRTLETIVEIKHQFLQLLVSIGFVPVDLPPKRKIVTDNVATLTGPQLNINGENHRLLVSLLCAALYPNVVKVLTPEKSYTKTAGGAMPKMVQPTDLRFKTREDGYVALHPSSVNSNIGNFLSPYLVYQEKVKTSRIFIRECSMVPLFPLVFFSGSDLRIELHGGDFVVLLDNGWIVLKAQNHETAEMVNCMRQELVKLLEEKIRDPCLNLLHHENGKKIIATIVFLVSRE